MKAMQIAALDQVYAEFFGAHKRLPRNERHGFLLWLYCQGLIVHDGQLLPVDRRGPRLLKGRKRA